MFRRAAIRILPSIRCRSAAELWSAAPTRQALHVTQVCRYKRMSRMWPPLKGRLGRALVRAGESAGVQRRRSSQDGLVPEQPHRQGRSFPCNRTPRLLTIPLKCLALCAMHLQAPLKCGPPADYSTIYFKLVSP